MVLGLYGAGGFGKETFDMVTLHMSDKWDTVVFIDDADIDTPIKGARVMKYSEFKDEYPPEIAGITITLGEPDTKRKIYERVKSDGYSLPVLIHPQAYVADDAVLEEGVIIFYGSTISSTVKMGKCSSTLTYTLVGHDAVIGDFSQVSAMVLINGGVETGDGVFIGGGAILREFIKVGNRSVVSMGACVMKDVPDEVIVMGNPARVIQKRGEESVFGNRRGE